MVAVVIVEALVVTVSVIVVVAVVVRAYSSGGRPHMKERIRRELLIGSGKR